MLIREPHDIIWSAAKQLAQFLYGGSGDITIFPDIIYGFVSDAVLEQIVL